MIFDVENSHWKSDFWSFYKTVKLSKASEDFNNQGGGLILHLLLNQLVAKSVASDPHDFTLQLWKRNVEQHYFLAVRTTKVFAVGRFFFLQKNIDFIYPLFVC